MKNSNFIFTKLRMGLDKSVWLTMLILLLCSTFFLGFKIFTHVDCSSFEIATSGLRQQTNNVFYVGEAITFSIPATSNDKVQWNFDDGTPGKDERNIIQHSFLKEEDYHISCIVNDKCSEGLTISIISRPAIRQADTTQFTGVPIIGTDTVVAGVSAHFNTLIKASYSYQWSLSGSPDIKTTPFADFNFYKHGVQMITLTIDGDKRFTKTIVVLPHRAAGNVLNSGGNSLPAKTIAIPPALNSIYPTSGGAGTSVTIRGSFFNGTRSVSFGGIEAKSFKIVSPNEITAIVNDGSQSGIVTVTTDNGPSPASQQFTYIAPKAATANPPAPLPPGASAPVRKGISNPNLFTLLKKVTAGDPNVSTKIVAEYFCGGENTLVKANSEKKAITLSALCERLQTLKEVTVESAKINWDPNNPDCETNILVTYSQPKKFLGVKYGKKRD